MKKKKRYTSEEKSIILREHLENKIPVSDLAEKYEIHPNALYVWKKQLFEKAPATIGNKSKIEARSLSKAGKRIDELEATIAMRESLITQLVQENIDLKKNTNGEVLTRNGLSRRSGTKW